MRRAVALAVALLAAGPVRAGPGDVARIRVARAAYNAALAAHDWPAMRAFLLPDYTVLPGSGGRPLDQAAMATQLGAAFADPAFVTYVRTPGRIRVADDGRRAAETGRWIGLWRRAGGKMRLSGVYQATWEPSAAGWRLRNEAFVTLRCVGRGCDPR